MPACLSVSYMPVFCQNGCTYHQTFSLSDSHTILVFRHQTVWHYSDRDLLTAASNAGGCKRIWFSANISLCLSPLRNWFCHNGNVLNSSKSESILFGTRHRLCNCLFVSIPTIAGSQIPFFDNIKPWVWLSMLISHSTNTSNHSVNRCIFIPGHCAIFVLNYLTAWPPH